MVRYKSMQRPSGRLASESAQSEGKSYVVAVCPTVLGAFSAPLTGFYPPLLLLLLPCTGVSHFISSHSSLPSILPLPSPVQSPATPGGVFLRAPTMPHSALWIDDPLRPGMNIGAGSYNMWRVQVRG